MSDAPKFIDGEYLYGVEFYRVKKIDCEVEGQGCIAHKCPLFVGRGHEIDGSLGFCRYYGMDCIIKKGEGKK